MKDLEFKKNEEYEQLLQSINSLLEPVNRKQLKNFTTPQHPVIILVGAPRSGTTLIYQWLCSLNIFSYPTNFVSRFYKSPYLGFLIQNLLIKESFTEDFKLLNHQGNFESNLGKTKGALSPHEFWYFWRDIFPTKRKLDYITANAVTEKRMKKFLSSVAAIENATGKPVCFKGLILNNTIQKFQNYFKNVIFIHVKRDTILNAQSILMARKKIGGSFADWFSFKPNEYSKLIKLSPCKQAVGQVHYTNKAIEEQTAQLPLKNYLNIAYEEFCLKPESYYEQLVEKLKELNLDVPETYKGKKRFTSSNVLRLTPAEINEMQNYHHRLLSEQDNFKQ